MSVDLYACETWSVALSEVHRLKVFENRVLRKIFGPKRDHVTGNEKGYIKKSPTIRSLLLTKDYSAGEVKRNEMGRACGTYGRRKIDLKKLEWRNGLHIFDSE